MMEEARKRAAKLGRHDILRKFYTTDYAYLKEGKVAVLWDDILLHKKDTIPEFTLWRNAESVKMVPSGARRILEIGIGMGHALRGLSAAIPGLEYYGVDTSKQAVENAGKLFKGQFAVAGIENLPWPGTQFDVILMLEVLEHIEVTRTFSVLNTLRSRLADNGRLILSVPLGSVEDLRQSSFICPHCGDFVDPNGHIRSYIDLQPISAELALAGFEIELEQGLAGGKYYGLPRQWLKKFFPKRIKPMVMIFRCRKMPEPKV